MSAITSASSSGQGAAPAAAAKAPRTPRRRTRRLTGADRTVVSLMVGVPLLFVVTLVWLPPYSPEINPVERVWLYLREKHWSHRLLDTHDAVVDALRRAWNALTAERIRSLTSYPSPEQVEVYSGLRSDLNANPL